MLDISRQPKAMPGGMGTTRSYKEIVEYLDKLPVRAYDAQVPERMRRLDTACGDIAQKLSCILIAGTNGKSTALNFTARLLQEENVSTTLAYASHIMHYNERFMCDGRKISNKDFAALLNEVIAIAEVEKIAATSHELTTMAGMLYAYKNDSQVAVLEVGLGGRFDPTAICKARVIALTRVGDDASGLIGSSDLDAVTNELMTVVQPNAWFISSEQSKLRLTKMRTMVEERGGCWSMPIRKLAPLPYIYEQLYGRIASLSERIVQLYLEEVLKKFSPFLRGNLLATQQGKRGRPTLAAQRQAELNPVKTLKTFWATSGDMLRGRFEILHNESPTIVLDNASNVDAFVNFFLGVRLYHYEHPSRGFTLIIGVARALDAQEVLKSIRYLLKKVPGKVFFVELSEGLPCYTTAELMEHAAKINLNARCFAHINEAIRVAKSMVDERDGLIAITGSEKQVAAYWKSRGAKRFY